MIENGWNLKLENLFQKFLFYRNRGFCNVKTCNSTIYPHLHSSFWSFSKIANTLERKRILIGRSSTLQNLVRLCLGSTLALFRTAWQLELLIAKLTIYVNPKRLRNITGIQQISFSVAFLNENNISPL